MTRFNPKLAIFLGIVLAAGINAFLVGLVVALYLAGDPAERTLAGVVVAPAAWLVICCAGFGVEQSRRFFVGNLAVALLAGAAVLIRAAG